MKKEKPSYQKYYDFLDRIYTKPKKTLIAISWWPDSIYVAHIIQQYWAYKSYNPQKLYYIYCDHNIRKNTDDIKHITKIVPKKSIYVIKREGSSTKDEESLRTRRYEQIRNYSKIHNIKILITGHNLSDRIESTLLNLLRGAQIDGFLSMKKIEKKSHIFDGSIVRPLLDDGKDSIYLFCKQANLSYSTDTTNQDKDFSKRNNIRHTILQPLKELSHKYNTESNSFEQSMQHIYKRCEQHHKTPNIKLLPIPRYTLWESDRAYRRDIQQTKITQTHIKHIVKTLHISHNITQKNIAELYDFLKHKHKWHKYINGHYRFIAHKKIYIIKAKKNFWLEKIQDKPVNINDMFESTVTFKDLPHNRRISKETDKIKGKSINKRCINKKIPIFWRNNIIVSKDTKNDIQPHIPEEMLI